MPEVDYGPATAYRRRDPAVRMFNRMLASDPGGPPTDNRWEQSQHYRGMTYLGIQALMHGLAGGTLRAVARKKDRGRVVTKALPSPGRQTADERWLPLPDGHFLARLARRPNPRQTTTGLLHDMVLQRSLTGTTHLYVQPDRTWGQPCRLYVLPTALMTWHPASAQYPEGAWRMTSWYPGNFFGGAAAAGCLLDARDVHRLKTPHPLWWWDGYSPLTAGGRELDVLESIVEAWKAGMDRGLTLDAIINVPNGDKASLDRIEAAFVGKTGARNHRGIAAVDSDRIDVKTFSTTNKELDYGSGWDRMSKFSLALMDVPPTVAGLDAAGSYAQLFAAIKQFRVLTLEPLAKEVGEFLTHHVAARFGERFAYQIDLPSMDDPDLLEKQVSTDAGNHAITVNQIAALRNRPPVEGGDVPPAVYVEWLKAKVLPQQPPPGQPPDAGGGGNPLAALMGGGDDDQDGPPKGPSGPNAGKPPQPDNPAGKGSLPPKPGPAAVNKACEPASTLEGAAGGFLVPPPGQPARRKRKRRRPDRVLAAVLANLPPPSVLRKAFEEEKHPRDHGKFASTGGGSGGTATADPPASPPPPGRLARARDAADAALDRRGGKVYRGAKVAVHYAEATMTAAMKRTQRLAAEAARERGLSEEQVAKLHRVLAAVDIAASWVSGKGVTAATGGNVALGYAAGMMPTASAAYLAYSTARDPKATLRAAKKLLRGQAKPLPGEAVTHKALPGDEPQPHDPRAFAAYLADAQDVEWAGAVLAAALDECGGDPAAALARAYETLADNPVEPPALSPDDDDGEFDEDDDEYDDDEEEGPEG